MKGLEEELVRDWDRVEWVLQGWGEGFVYMERHFWRLCEQISVSFSNVRSSLSAKTWFYGYRQIRNPPPLPLYFITHIPHAQSHSQSLLGFSKSSHRAFPP